MINFRFSVSNPAIVWIPVILSGVAALSWEVIWQLKSSLALGVSAWGTALTLAVMMGSMGTGSLVLGSLLKKKTIARPLFLFGILEFVIGVSGLLVDPLFHMVESLDSRIYAVAPSYAPLVHILGIASVIGIPAIAMGATLPVLGLAARQFKTSIAILYGLNTFSAAIGALLAAFLWLPWLGVNHAVWLFANLNFAGGLIAVLCAPSGDALPATGEPSKARADASLPGFYAQSVIAFMTGFATFMLEVSWFRSMTAAFLSTTDAFAIMLAAVLVALALGAYFVPVLKRNRLHLGVLVAMAGIAILIVTPIVERFDLFMYYSTKYPVILFTRWFFLTLYIIGIPVTLLGIALPWLLDAQTGTRKWGTLYGINTLAAIIGSVCAGWLFLPTIGFARTAWLTGALVLVTGLLIAPRHRRLTLALAGVLALVLAVTFESGIGRTRVQGAIAFRENYEPTRIVEVREGPAATISVVEYGTGRLILFIDGFSTTRQSGLQSAFLPEHYMPWMGHLPMLLHPDPKNALVICFGTGQTANAVRKENPERLDIVDINANVFKLAHNFPANENVLDDPRINTITMDGRAYIRRTREKYDVITLEPMPPHFAGANALYSREFYEEARSKLTSSGIIAQWLPFHLVPPHYSASIARTFQSVFPNAILWIDPPSTTGILLGSKDDDGFLGRSLPGYRRSNIERDLSAAQIKDAILLNRNELLRYGLNGEIISDDNQLLTYGEAAYLFRELKKNRNKENFELLNKVKTTPTAPVVRQQD